MKKVFVVYGLSLERGVWSSGDTIVEVERVQSKLIEDALKAKKGVEGKSVWVKIKFYAEEEMSGDNCFQCKDCKIVYPKPYYDFCECGGDLEPKYIGGL